MIKLDPLYFVFEDDVLTVINKESLINAAGYANKRLTILIEGHTDDRGTEEYNKLLLIKRAEKRKQMMLEMSVSEDKLKIIGYGEERPITDNSPGEGRQINRGVDLRFCKS